jgi:hypothetical protein
LVWVMVSGLASVRVTVSGRAWVGHSTKQLETRRRRNLREALRN